MSDGTGLTPSKGDRYISTVTTADWAGQGFSVSTHDIVWYDDASVGWRKDSPLEGWKSYNSDDGAFYVFDGTIWGSASVTDGLTLESVTGEVTIDSSSVDVDWNLEDNDTEALTFITATNVPVLNFNTTDGQEAVELGADIELDMNGGDVNLNSSTTITLSNNADAVEFYATNDTTSALTLSGTDSLATFGSDVVINGDLLIKGATTTISTEEMVVSDPTITLNDGNTVSAIGVGLEFEVNDTVAGYIKTTAAGFDLDPTETNNTLTLDLDAAATIQVAGGLSIEADSVIDQDLTVDSTVVEFAGLKLTGDIDLTDAARSITLASSAVALDIASGLLNVDTVNGKITTTGDIDITGDLIVDGGIDLSQTGSANAVTLTDDLTSSLTFGSAGAAGILAIDTDNGAEGVTMSGTLGVTGDVTLAAELVFPAALQDGTEYISDGAASANVAQIEKSFDTRAQYDNVLKVMRFVDADIYAV